MRDADITSDLDKPEIVWLGDDFTGAAAVMEVLTFAGMPSILFLDTPTPEQLAVSKGFKAFGIATMARAQPPEWMAENLPSFYAFLDGTGAALVHYKICSTLDSSPRIGSIGRAIELACDQFGASAVPVVTAAPRMQRYQIFGNLFCGAGSEVYRLDRHPVMARHPVTPMREADVALHLAEQTDIQTYCLDHNGLSDPARIRACLDRQGDAGICTIDMSDDRHERIVGRLLWEGRQKNRFVVGSQGIEYALVAHFLEAGKLTENEPPKSLGPTSRMAVVSGSVSPITAAQIGWARQNGFAAIRLDVLKICSGDAGRAEAELAAIDGAKSALSEGLIPLVFSAEGPDDPAVAALRASDADPAVANTLLGQSLGRILKRLIDDTGLGRVVVSGGDTSGLVCGELGVFALEAVSPTIPGAALCRARSDTGLDGLEIALKGGQMGSQDYFGWIRDGGGERS
ncbi:four-carbon acid sugar kinase family protein [Nisaea sp.]|uniref:four-carbon acid sugar kinase family protein n=1 Tax=Nisaea sp. TaxID=2024842 RepID=UPI003299A49C